MEPAFRPRSSREELRRFTELSVLPTWPPASYRQVPAEGVSSLHSQSPPISLWEPRQPLLQKRDSVLQCPES